MKRKIIYCIISCLTLITLTSGIAYTLNGSIIDSTDIAKTDLLLQSVDSTINAICIKTTVSTRENKIFFNKRENQKEEIINKRRQRGTKNPFDPYRAKVVDSDPVNISLENISVLNNKTRIVRDYENDVEDHIVFYEPGKMYEIRYRDRDMTQKMVYIDEINDKVYPFNAITAHTFGRGLSFYAGVPKRLEKIDDSLYKLLIYSPKDTDKTVAEFVLDSAKDFCWTKGTLYNDSGDVQMELTATSYKEIDSNYYPFHVTLSAYHDGDFAYQHDVNVNTIERLNEDSEELNVFNDIPTNARIIK